MTSRKPCVMRGFFGIMVQQEPDTLVEVWLFVYNFVDSGNCCITITM